METGQVLTGLTLRGVIAVGSLLSGGYHIQTSRLSQQKAEKSRQRGSEKPHPPSEWERIHEIEYRDSFEVT